MIMQEEKKEKCHPRPVTKSGDKVDRNDDAFFRCSLRKISFARRSPHAIIGHTASRVNSMGNTLFLPPRFVGLSHALVET